MTDQSLFRHASWFRAATLTERLASLRASTSTASRDNVNHDVARRRLERWRSEPEFADESRFGERLAMDGMTEDEFLYLLGEPIEAVGGRFASAPEWLAKLDAAFSPFNASTGGLSEDDLPTEAMDGFLPLIEPLIRRGYSRFREGIIGLHSRRDSLPFDTATVGNLLYRNLPGHLARLLSRTLALELNVARLRGVLHGATPEERFESFIERLREPEVSLAILEEYPVLARQLVLAMDNWIDTNLEFLGRLVADWGAILETFTGTKDPGLLTEVTGGAGDSHRGGRSVFVARFSSGFRLVYKPRPMSLDVHFQELLTWVNERDGETAFRTLTILDRNTHGWVEFVAAEPCVSEDQVRRFYERQGGYLALLYLLNATDFHYENLIAAGDQPILIDLEALFHPHTSTFDLRRASELASSKLSYSVLGIGLLPQRAWLNEKSEGVDMSGLGGAAGQVLPFAVPQWEEVGTDQLRLSRKPMSSEGGQNLPTLNGASVSLVDYTEAIVEGFSRVYRCLREHRDELLAERSPLAPFAHDAVRVVIRATWTYGILLRESFHPDMLRDALDRDRLLDRLWVGVDQLPQHPKVIEAEREDLLGGDIPLFMARPNSRHLWTSSNRIIEDYFEESSLESVQQRLREMDEKDLFRQTWLIRASMLALAPSREQIIGARAKGGASYGAGPRMTFDRSRLLAAACRVGDRLESLAVRGENDISWIGLAQVNESRWSLVPLDADMYDGVPGVALFLAYLGNVTGEARYTRMAEAALITVRDLVERGNSVLTVIGGFFGWGGLIYTYAHLGTLWSRPALLEEAEMMADKLPTLIERDERFDIIAGAAGCIGSLLSLHSCVPPERRARVLAAAIQCGDRLIAGAQPMEQGIGWASMGAGTTPLSGFSHGAGGIAWALLRLASLTGLQRFRDAALAAIAYERSLYSGEIGNWRDLRDLGEFGRVLDSSHDESPIAWCHGAAGIGLGRLSGLPYLDDDLVRSEINAALTTTIGWGFGGNHSICHGDLGNLELVLQAGETLGEPRWSEEAQRLTGAILASIDGEGWLCGNPFHVESPGLMTGISGIGYQLLRLAEPAGVPPILTLAPPVPSR